MVVHSRSVGTLYKNIDSSEHNNLRPEKQVPATLIAMDQPSTMIHFSPVVVIMSIRTLGPKHPRARASSVILMMSFIPHTRVAGVIVRVISVGVIVG